MTDQVGQGVPLETTQAWDTVRRVREPMAWALLALAAIVVVVTACQLFNVAGAKAPVPVPVSTAVPVTTTVGSAAPSAAPVSAFALRASAVAPQFFAAVVLILPVASVVLVSFIGGLTEHARAVVQSAAVVQAVAFVLGVIGLAGAADSHRWPGTLFVLEVPGLAAVAIALVFTGAVLWSRELRSLGPRFQVLGDDEDVDDDDEDFADDDERFGER